MGLCAGSSGRRAARIARVAGKIEGSEFRMFHLGSLESNICALASSRNDVADVFIVLFEISYMRWRLLNFFGHGGDAGGGRVLFGQSGLQPETGPVIEPSKNCRQPRANPSALWPPNCLPPLPSGSTCLLPNAISDSILGGTLAVSGPVDQCAS